MAEGVGWRNFWWFNAALNIFAILVALVCLPETKWSRPKLLAHDCLNSPDLQPTKLPMVDTTSQKSSTSDPMPIRSHTRNTASTLHRPSEGSPLGRGKPGKRQWSLIQQTDHPVQSLIQAFCLPWQLLCFPIVQFASFVVGFSSTCYLMITFVQSEVFTPPPYKFSLQSVGFTNFASLAGAILGLLTAGPLSDWVSAKLTKRNNGVREPEMRLVTMIPYTLIMLLGNFVVGFGFQYQWDWRVSKSLLFTIHYRKY